MKAPHFAVVLVLSCGAFLHTQHELSAQETQTKCAQYLKTPLPAEALTIAVPKVWPACDSYKSYSGIGRKVDFEAARRCAWEERLAQQAGFEPRYTVASIFGGSAMLAVLYANGEGVEQNKAFALRFACESGLEENGIEDIRLLPNVPHVTEKRFRYCDEVSNTMEIGFCSGWDAEIQDWKRHSFIHQLTVHWPPPHREALRTLIDAEEKYSGAHAAGEIDLSGSGRAIWQIDAENTLREDFLAALKTFEAGRFPSGSATQYKAADAQLNRAYRRALNDANTHKDEYGAIQPEGIRDAERAWLKYRDAWITFAKVRYPGVPTEAWLVLLTNDRTSILDGSFCDMDAEDGPCAQKGDTWKPSPLP